MKNSRTENFLNWLIELFTAFIICILIIIFVAQVSFVRLDSMLPTIRNDDVLIIEKITPKLHKIQRQDIITLKNVYANGEDTEMLIKRVIAVAGDKIEIKDGRVYINGVILKEGYINGIETKSVRSEFSVLTVPENSVYVMGDNRLPGASLDSRTFGVIRIEKITGKAVFRIFPFNEFGILK